MSPQNTRHAIVLPWCGDYLRDLLKGQAILRVQSPITIPPDSEPEPDLAIVVPEISRYFDHHPLPEDIYLVIEIYDTTLSKDRQVKVPIYSQAKIPEYWIIDINKKEIYIFRKLGLSNYKQKLILKEDARFFLQSFPIIQIGLSDLFPF